MTPTPGALRGIYLGDGGEQSAYASKVLGSGDQNTSCIYSGMAKSCCAP